MAEKEPTQEQIKEGDVPLEAGRSNLTSRTKELIIERGEPSWIR